MTSLRDHLVHVIPTLRVDGVLDLAATLIFETYTRFQHTVLHTTPYRDCDTELMAYLQNAGADVIQADVVTAAMLEEGGYTGAMFYNITTAEADTDAGAAVPTLYYSYGTYDPVIKADVVVPCSKFAAKCDRRGTGLDLDPDLAIAAMVPTRAMRRLRLRRRAPGFSVGILGSATPGKYADKLLIELMTKLPHDITVYYTALPAYRHAGVPMAIAARRDSGAHVIGCALRSKASLHYLLHCDVMVHASAPGHYEPYGRYVVEAAAAGIPIISDASGVMGNELQHEWNAIIANTSDDVVAAIARLRQDTQLRERLIANGQLWASWHDSSVHIGALKAIWRELGI